uniref:Uncharacterized protein n=1 Tax=Anguilla anguilla TaxID=7936 RepID=A0A0E9TV92_ANGAN
MDSGIVVRSEDQTSSSRSLSQRNLLSIIHLKKRSA